MLPRGLECLHIPEPRAGPRYTWWLGRAGKHGVSSSLFANMRLGVSMSAIQRCLPKSARRICRVELSPTQTLADRYLFLVKDSAHIRRCTIAWMRRSRLPLAGRVPPEMSDGLGLRNHCDSAQPFFSPGCDRDGDDVLSRNRTIRPMSEKHCPTRRDVGKSRGREGQGIKLHWTSSINAELSWRSVDGSRAVVETMGEPVQHWASHVLSRAAGLNKDQRTTVPASHHTSEELYTSSCL